MSLTALDLSPEALKKYHPREAVRRRREKLSTEISARRKRAMTAAHKAAELLKTNFGATEVILFGSLARRSSFTLFSDIDLAARGIHSDHYLSAMEAVLYLDAEFKIDLVDIETCLPAMRENIERDAKPL